MTETPKNPFEALQAAEKTKPKRGRPAKKKPLQDSTPTDTPVGETRRKKRIPVGLRDQSKTPTREGFKRRWVDDVADRLTIFAEGSYTNVLDSEGKPLTRRGGAGKIQYLMEIDEELYNSDQEVKYKQWNESAQERLKPREGMQGFYQPKTKHNYR